MRFHRLSNANYVCTSRAHQCLQVSTVLAIPGYERQAVVRMHQHSLLLFQPSKDTFLVRLTEVTRLSYVRRVDVCQRLLWCQMVQHHECLSLLCFSVLCVAISLKTKSVSMHGMHHELSRSVPKLLNNCLRGNIDVFFQECLNWKTPQACSWGPAAV